MVPVFLFKNSVHGDAAIAKHRSVIKLLVLYIWPLKVICGGWILCIRITQRQFLLVQVLGMYFSECPHKNFLDNLWTWEINVDLNFFFFWINLEVYILLCLTSEEICLWFRGNYKIMFENGGLETPKDMRLISSFISTGPLSCGLLCNDVKHYIMTI